MKKTLILFAFIVLSQISKAQQGFGTNNPDPSSVIDMTATNKGALLPRVALTSTIVAAPVNTPADALTVFNTATDGVAPNNVTPGYYYWSILQTKWIRLKDANDLNVQDLRLVGTRSHITQDAGVGANGTSVGTGTDNIGIGSQALLSNNTGFANIGIGTETLSKNGSGSFNVALGTIALANATGDMNTGLGHGTGYDLTTGAYNTLIGAFAGHRITTAIGNIAIGHNAYATSTLAPATGNNNTLIGNEAGYILSSGSRNVGLGQSVFYSSGGGFPTGTTTGNDNVALGYQSARNITTGSNNLAIGSGINVQTGTASNQMNIKNTIFGTGMSGTLAVPAGNIGINVAAPTNTLHVKAAADPARLEGLQTGTITGATPDNIVVANSTGVLKTIAASTLASSLEPWNMQGGILPATANSQNIYQLGNVGVGDFTGTSSAKKLEVKGNFKSQVSASGNIYGMEVDNPLIPGTQVSSTYWLGATGSYRVGAVHSTSAFITAGTNGTNPNAGIESIMSTDDLRATVSSRDKSGSSKAELRTDASGGFNLESFNVAGNYGGTLSLLNDGIRLRHTNTNGILDAFPVNNMTEIFVQKTNGIRFNFRDGAGTTTGQYWFPTTTGTNGQVMTQTATGNIIWTSPSTFGAANNGLTKNVTTGEFELGGTLNRVTSIATTASNTLAITGLPTGAATDNIVLSSTGGQLKTITTDNLVQEPWNVQGGTTKATANGQNIYQTGSVAIGASSIPSITVGASTINPMFHVAGDVSTTGKIYTTNSVYADYVFEKYFAGKSEINPNYEFKSLDYVRNFIKANNHLPGVQSINDLTKANNGYTFDMTKLTIQSLEKIEELYIHTIEQKDKIDAQRAEIEKLKKDAEETKKRLERLEKLLLKN